MRVKKGRISKILFSFFLIMSKALYQNYSKNKIDISIFRYHFIMHCVCHISPNLSKKEHTCLEMCHKFSAKFSESCFQENKSFLVFY